MSPLFSKKCPSCGSDNNNDAKFCAICGTPFAGSGGKMCSFCGTNNRMDAKYCKKCGRELNAFEEVELQKNHWSRNKGDFAARLEVNDLPGLLSKKLEVELGTQALVIAGGTPQEILPPGLYTMDSVGKSILNWLKGIPKTVTVLLVDAAPTEMIIQVDNRFTSDPLPISLKIRLVVEVEDASKFLITALRGRERYSLDDLRQYIEPEVTTVVDSYLRKRTLEQLIETPNVRSELELAVDESLRLTFRQYGMKLLSMRTAEFDLVAYDKVKGITGRYSLLISEGEAELTGKQRVAELQKKVDLQNLAEETSKIELEERKVDLYQRVRQTALSDKMNEVKSEEQFRKFMDDIDYQKLLSEKERQELLQGWKEAAEDHNRARAFLLAKADVEEEYQLKSIEIKSSGEVALQELDFQLELARKRADMSLQIEEMKWESDLKKRQREIEIHQIEFKQDITEAEEGLRILDLMERQENSRKFELEEHALKMRLDEARANVEIEIVRLDSEHKREMERLEKLGTLGTEALIAASPAEQGRILQDLKRMEIYKTMSEDQILALAAEKNPELGKVFEEKYRAIAEGKADQREREMYEKLIAENKDSQRMLMETQKDAMDRVQQMSQHGMDSIKEISIAYAHREPTPIVIAGTGGESVIHTSRSGMDSTKEEMKTCPECGRQVVVSSRFCQYCNNEFKDVK
jgi:hypothetical protein